MSANTLPARQRPPKGRQRPRGEAKGGAAPGPRMQKGMRLFEQGRFAEAHDAFSRHVAAHKKDPDALQLLGMCKIHTGRQDAGLALMKRAVSLRPDQQHRWISYGGFLHHAGRTEEAGAAMLRAADLPGGAVIPLYNYCVALKPDPDHAAPRRLRRMLESESLKQSARAYALYGLSAVADGAGDGGQALDLALKGGAAAGVECALDPVGARRIIAANSHAALRRAPMGGDLQARPVFILGMPRSGTTLTEQILSRHPEVAACGELPGGRTAELLAIQYARQTAGVLEEAQAIAHIPPEVESVAAAHHLQTAQGKAGADFRRIWTDKLPENLFRLGLLGRMFPNAKVVALRRHPLDVCVSCLLKRFSDVQYSYTNTIETLADHYLAHEAVLFHFVRTSPLPVHILSYEDLATDPEPQVRALLDFLDLPFDPACLRPEDGARMVNTASADQVREGIHTKSLGRWRNYAAGLGPLIERLGGMARVEAMAGPFDRQASTPHA